MNARELLRGTPVTIEPGAGIHEAVTLMESRRIRHLPVVESGKLVGLISDRDILLLLGRSRGERWMNALEAWEPAVERVMSTSVRSISPDLGLDEIVEFLISHRFSALPVMDGGELIGVITTTDVMRWYREFCDSQPKNPAAQRTVRTRMQHNVQSLPGDATLQEAYDLMVSAKIQHVPITKDGRLIGICSDRDIRRVLGMTVRLGEEADAETSSTPCGIPLHTVMKSEPITIDPDQLLSEAAGLMMEHRISSLPAVAGDILAGIITSTDILCAVRGLVVCVPA